MQKVIQITAKGGAPLNAIADYALDHAQDLIDQLQDFELVAGQSAKMGGGEPIVSQIKITAIIENPEESDGGDLDKLLEILVRKAAQLEVVLNVKEV
nr:hypothetical protein [uncultured Cohaesibacter sp.]